MLVPAPVQCTPTPSIRASKPFQAFRIVRHASAPKARPVNDQTFSTLPPPDQQQSRVRRISHSAASKRFPKDFFSSKHCLMPTKTVRHRKGEASLISIEKNVKRKMSKEDECPTPKFKAKGQGSQQGWNTRRQMLRELNQNYHGQQAVKGIMMQAKEQQGIMGGVLGGEMELTLGQRLPNCVTMIRQPRRLRRPMDGKENKERELSVAKRRKGGRG